VSESGGVWEWRGEICNSLTILPAGTYHLYIRGFNSGEELQRTGTPQTPKFMKTLSTQIAIGLGSSASLLAV